MRFEGKRGMARDRVLNNFYNKNVELHQFLDILSEYIGKLFALFANAHCIVKMSCAEPVSYTHLTLPTIYSV